MGTNPIVLWTPWGLASRQDHVEIGFVAVNAPLGRGIMVRMMWARKNLSEPARNRAHFYDRFWMCYGEKWEWAIPAYETEPRFWERIFEGFADRVTEPPKEYLHKFLSLHAADYLREIGDHPEPRLADRWAKRQRRSELIAASDPNIVDRQTGSEWRTGESDVVEVRTGDGRYFFVTKNSFDKSDPDLRLLSDLEVVRQRPAFGRL